MLPEKRGNSSVIRNKQARRTTRRNKSLRGQENGVARTGEEWEHRFLTARQAKRLVSSNQSAGQWQKLGKVCLEGLFFSSNGKMRLLPNNKKGQEQNIEQESLWNEANTENTRDVRWCRRTLGSDTRSKGFHPFTSPLLLFLLLPQSLPFPVLKKKKKKQKEKPTSQFILRRKFMICFICSNLSRGGYFHPRYPRVAN